MASECPRCSESLEDGAAVCKHCLYILGRDRGETMRVASERTIVAAGIRSAILRLARYQSTAADELLALQRQQWWVVPRIAAFTCSRPACSAGVARSAAEQSQAFRRFLCNLTGTYLMWYI